MLNWVVARLHASGFLSPDRAVVLEVAGRRSGRRILLPVATVDYRADHFIVSMLGSDAQWVRNVRAAGGHVVLHCGGATPCLLEDVAPAERAPILRRYLAISPGARPHFPIDRSAPLAEFEAMADRYPVFRIRSRVPPRTADPQGSGPRGRPPR